MELTVQVTWSSISDDVKLWRSHEIGRSLGVEFCPKVLNGSGSHRRVRDFGMEQAIQQLFVGDIVLLVQPECLQ